ncbi:MAG: hypothetical protein JOZ19_00915 [Rubrobacter sp.]|nr:hypothetical protein [Rubrobacter sp.]
MPSLRAKFQSLQPFNHGESAPKQPLAVLEELWNIDKHRHLPLTNYLVELHDVGILPDSGAPEVEFRILKKRPKGPLKGRTEVGRVEPIGEGKSHLLEMHVNPSATFDIAFEKGPPAYGDTVVSTILRLRDCVANILVDFDAVWLGSHG